MRGNCDLHTSIDSVSPVCGIFINTEPQPQSGGPFSWSLHDFNGVLDDYDWSCQEPLVSLVVGMWDESA